MTLACTPTGWKPNEKATLDWMRWTSRSRGLEFKEPVDFRYIGYWELRSKLRRMSTGPEDPQEYKQMLDAYSALGLVPWLAESAAEEVRDAVVNPAGLYIPEEKRLYVVPQVHLHAWSLRSTVMHELVHALQHQNFPEIMGEDRRRIENLDVAMAVRALIEGDANFAMLAADPDDPFERTLDGAHAYQALNLPAPWEAREAQAETSGGSRATSEDWEMQPLGDDALSSATSLTHTHNQSADEEGARVVLSEIMGTFPYAQGMLFAARAYESGGNAAVDAWLEDPPLSTLQLRIPGAEREAIEFIRLPEAELRQAMQHQGCEAGASGVVGTLGLDALFYDHSPQPGDAELITAWRGDRFLHTYCPDSGPLEKSWVVIWMTRWSDAAAAQRFAERYRAITSELANTRPLAGATLAQVRGRSVLVHTPGLEIWAEPLWERNEVRPYSRLNDWLADGCFGDSTCPGDEGL